MNKQLLSADTEKNKTIISENEAIMNMISESLLDLGFRPKLKGFSYVREAIYHYINAPFVSSIGTDVYSKIIRKYNISYASIDRAIKTSIENTWYKSELNIGHELFKWSVIKINYHPTNSEFIATMAELIKFRIKKDSRKTI